MKTITIHRLSLQANSPPECDNPELAARMIVDAINCVLQREPFDMDAQLIATPDEIEVEFGDNELDS
jgi:hypothetical protein